MTVRGRTVVNFGSDSFLGLDQDPRLQAAIRRDGLTTIAQVGLRTRATTGCGGCAAEVQQLLDAAASTAG